MDTSEKSSTNVPQARRITLPSELSSLLTEIKDAVRAGHLRQVRPDPSPFATDVAVEDLPPSGPWPDHIELRFVSADTNARFKLSVETYHGTGGSWDRE